MFTLNNAVLLIENKLDNVSEIAETIAACGYEANRIEASNPSDVVSSIQSYSPDIIMCHTSRATPATEAIVQSDRPIVLILVGNATDIPMFETHSSVKIGYITAPFSPAVLKAIITLLV